MNPNLDPETRARLLSAFLDESSPEGEELREAFSRRFNPQADAFDDLRPDPRAQASLAEADRARREGPWWKRVAASILAPQATLQFAATPGRLSAGGSDAPHATFPLPDELAPHFRGDLAMEATGRGGRRQLSLRMPALVERVLSGEDAPRFDVEIEGRDEEGGSVTVLAVTLAPGERSGPHEVEWSGGDWTIHVESALDAG